MSLVLALDLEHSCPWPREGRSSKRLSLVLGLGFFYVLGLEPCVLDSTSYLYSRKLKKKSLQIFCKVSGVFLRNFNGLKIVLSSSRGQGNFWGLEASRPRPRTSKYVLKNVLEAKDVLEDSTSAKHRSRNGKVDFLRTYSIKKKLVGRAYRVYFTTAALVFIFEKTLVPLLLPVLPQFGARLCNNTRWINPAQRHNMQLQDFSTRLTE